MICISTGGKLQDLAEKRQVPFVKIPAGIQPRAATAYLLFPSIIFLKKIGLLKTAIETDIEETIAVTQEFVTMNNKTVPEENNQAKQLAKKIFNTIPQIYGWGIYTPIAIRWRHQFNENSKVIARTRYCLQIVTIMISLVGLQNPEISKQFSCIIISG